MNYLKNSKIEINPSFEVGSKKRDIVNIYFEFRMSVNLSLTNIILLTAFIFIALGFLAHFTFINYTSTNELRDDKDVVIKENSNNSQIPSIGVAETKNIVIEKTYRVDQYTDIKDKSYVSLEAMKIFAKEKGVLTDLVDEFYYNGLEYGIPGEFMLAVATQETEHGRSWLAQNFNNIGGITCSNNSQFSGCGKMPNGTTSWQIYENLSQSVQHKAQVLKRVYIERDLTTIGEIQNTYAPIGADNDPEGLNAYWQENVLSFMNDILSIQEMLDNDTKKESESFVSNNE